MGFRKLDEHRVERRLRRIEAQLHDILTLLDSCVFDDQTRKPQTGSDYSDVALREIFRELDAEQQDIQLSLIDISAANDDRCL